MFRTKPLVLIVVSVAVLVCLIWWGASKPSVSQAPTSPSTTETQTQISTPPPAPSATPSAPKGYYDSLALECQKKQSPSCCVASVTKMKTGGYKLQPPQGCPIGYQANTNSCSDSYTWCEPVPPAKISINFTAPAADIKWVFGKTNTIQWIKETGSTGSVYLLSASDKSVVGWITQQTAPHQTSFAWNTRDLSISRTDPSKKTVATGAYIIKATFDGNPKIEFSSAPFSIIYESEVQIPVHNLTIQNYAFPSSSLTVKKGDKLVFTNNDPVTHTLNLTSYSPFVIPSGSQFTFDTNILTPGSYNFYSQAYPTLKITMTVQ